jgi:serine/threonine-protein kinase
MIGKTITHYKILEKLGEGGMGIVYRAEDNNLKRPVALKFISPVLTRDKFANEQFVFEAQTASSLDHQNISTIYEIDECDDGRMFISMAFYNGETLREKMSAGQIAVKDTVSIAVQIAEGLSRAHRKGIIHKDIKPANIMIDEDDTVKIIDFGLSKLLSTYKSATPQGTSGTVSYMSPEEIKGKGIDFRTDIWSLGIVMYEMLTGSRPFGGKYDQAVIYSILNQNPTSLENIRDDVPKIVERIVIKAMAKNPDNRYSDMEALLADFKRVAADLPGYEYSATAHKQKTQQEKHSIKSLAVLPLANLSNDPEQEYFTDGMTDALITDLAKIGSLKVISRTSVMRFKKTEKSLPEIAQELNVDAVVEGSVMRGKDKVQLTIQLIHAATDTHLWAETYERDLQDLLILKSDLVQAIAKEIKVTLTQQEKKRVSWVRPVNPELYDNYLKGLFHYHKVSPEHFDRALEYFHLVLDKDPNFALAYVGISGVWFTRTYWEVSPPKESIQKSKSSLYRALELDDTIEEAHSLLGTIKFYFDWDWEGAEREFRKAIQLNPNYGDAHFGFGAFLQAFKRNEESTKEVKRGLELDPLNSFTQSFWVGNLLHLHKYDEAIETLHEILKMDPNFPIVHRYLWICYQQKQMYDKAIEAARSYFNAAGKNEIACLLKPAHNAAGYKEVMNLVAEKVEETYKQTAIRPIWIARFYAYAGKKDPALKWLRIAFEERDPVLVNLGVSRDWDSLRDEPEFKDLLRQMNFP